MPKFTQTQIRIIRLLNDGMPHRRSEIQRLLCDDMATDGTIKVHICNLRKKLRTIGRDVVCEKTEVPSDSTYRQVQIRDPDYGG